MRVSFAGILRDRPEPLPPLDGEDSDPEYVTGATKQ
jgi:hypothetical protein